MPAEDVAAGPGFRDKAPFHPRPLDLPDGLVEGVERAPDLAVSPHLARLLGDGDGDRFLVRIQADGVDFLDGCLVPLLCC